LDLNHVLMGFDRKLEHELLPHELKTKLPPWFLMLPKMEQTTSEKVRLRRKFSQSLSRNSYAFFATCA
jgi:hypothetical protein